MPYPEAAWEQAMTVQEVLLKAISGELQSYLHGHSAHSRESSGHSGGKGRYGRAMLIPDTVSSRPSRIRCQAATGSWTRA
jgi:hypothetical protein